MKTMLNDELNLAQHGRSIAKQKMSEWFANDPTRQQRFTLEACGLSLDYSHNLITEETLNLLSGLCDQFQVRNQLEAMFHGNPVNTTEHRAALHTALRDPLPNPIMIGNSNIKQAILQCRHQAQSLAKKLGNESITDIVHIGLGGSYWGPLCVYQALSHLPAAYQVHFVATLDPAELSQILAKLNPRTTRFILASKSFTTQEMLDNASLAQAWLNQAGIDSTSEYFIAITENHAAALTWGVCSEHILPVWEWVGGRFSVWSMMSFPIILAYGFEVFDQMLAGAHAMDQHVMSQDWRTNMPALLAVIDYWYRTYFELNNLAIIPYEFALRSIIPHLQQLHMESLGKPGYGQTGGIVWGALGSHAQHTFNQLLQQGTEIVPIDFILSREACAKTPALADHCLAQRQSLMTGHASNNIHAVLLGNRPSNLITLDSLSPQHMGSLLALYEHKVVILAQLYGVNAFDQFGVEYSKKLARHGGYTRSQL